MSDPAQVTRATYDAVAVEFRERWSRVWPELREDLDAFAARLPSRARLADVGCGSGRDIVELRRRGLEVLGLDLSIGMLRASGLAGVVQGDMCMLPVASEALDGLWCQAAMLHVVRNEVPCVLAEFAGVVRPAGILYVAVSEGVGEGWETGAYGGGPRWFVRHDAQVLKELLAGAGFTVQRTAHRFNHRQWLNMFAIRSPQPSDGNVQR